MKKVTFSNKVTIFPYVSYQKHTCKTIDIRLNRKIRRIERYMRKVNLLLKTEYLELTKSKTKHIRGPYINFIAHKKKWISKRDNLEVIV